jgi:hypothetical protein
LNNKTLYVVGAGASHEFGLPLGIQLKSEITQVLRYKIDSGRLTEIDPVIHQAYSALAGRPDINPYLQASRRIVNAMPQAISIDNFIDA